MTVIHDIFKKFDPDYVDLLSKYNPTDLQPPYINTIQSYKVPNRSYLRPSARGVDLMNVSSDILEYIIFQCFTCSIKDKYEAILVVLHKVHESKASQKEVEAIKEKLMLTLKEPLPLRVDYSFISDVVGKHEDNFFYLLKISIGANTILKYGITDDDPRKRIAKIKSDIKVKYANQKIHVELLLLLHCKDNKTFEEEIKLLLSEHDVNASGYHFKGASETIPIGFKDTVIRYIIEPTIKRFDAEVLHQDTSMSME